MGNAPSNYVPLSVTSDYCKTADAVAEGARYDYECTSTNQVRYGLTLVHLFILVFAFLLSMLLYLVYNRICERRVHSALRAVPKRLPVGRDVLSARMHLAIVQGFARVGRPEFVPAPQHPRPAPAAAAAGAAELARFRTGVFAALQRLSVAVRESLADELWALRDGLRGARALLVSARFGAPPAAVDTVLAAAALAGLDYRGLLDDDEGGAGAAERAVARALPISAHGVQLVEEAVESIVLALSGAAGGAPREGDALLEEEGDEGDDERGFAAAGAESGFDDDGEDEEPEEEEAEEEATGAGGDEDEDAVDSSNEIEAQRDAARAGRPLEVQ